MDDSCDNRVYIWIVAIIEYIMDNIKSIYVYIYIYHNIHQLFHKVKYLN